MNPNNVDRRHVQHLRETALKHGINDDQLGTLQTLEQFGWLLKLVRDTPAGPLAAMHDPDKHCLAVIEPDGQLNENSSISFRPLHALMHPCLMPSIAGTHQIHNA